VGETQVEIYPDIIFLENIVMNYLILLVTAKFTKSKTTSLRLFLGSLTGAVCVVLLLLCPSTKVYYTVLGKFLLSLLIIAVSFSPEILRNFIKILAVFYASTFLFAGAAFAFLYFNQSGGFIRNGIVYVFWESNMTLLIFSVITVGIIAKVFWEIMQYRLIKDKLLVPLKISFESKIIDMSALVDTGNSLYDPLTNTPVIVVEFKAIKEILPKEIKSIFEECKEDDLSCVTSIVSHSTWFSRFRLIPFTSLGKENGMLIGFKPDYVEVGEEQQKKGVSNVIVGIYNRALSKNEKYRALLNPELIA
jgi:stage II sporulation protein GA (sporulation sigma-E factor processing peptidase)